MASQAEPLIKPILNAYLLPTAATGASKTAAITSSIGTMTKTAVAYEPGTDQKMSPDYGDSPSASSNPKTFAVYLKKCGSSHKMYVPSLTISAWPKTQWSEHDMGRTNLPWEIALAKLYKRVLCSKIIFPISFIYRSVKDRSSILTKKPTGLWLTLKTGSKMNRPLQTSHMRMKRASISVVLLRWINT